MSGLVPGFDDVSRSISLPVNPSQGQNPVPVMVLVDQTIVDRGKGDCHRAAVATMMQLPLEDVPDTHIWGKGWGIEQYNHWHERGWDFYYEPPERAHKSESPSGWVVATVPSRMYEGVTHSVVLDKDTLELVHDPNPQARRKTVERDEIQVVLIAMRVGHEAS